jgi:hypothetical protein
VLRLFDDPWKAFQAVKKSHSPRTIDVLTGFVGAGAWSALADLGLRGRVVLGLPSATAALRASQVQELALLTRDHRVKWLPGLHAKLYLFDNEVVAVGSANLTRPAFERLDEVLLVSDARAVVMRARALFEDRWSRASDVSPEKLRVLPQVAGGLSDLETGLGIAKRGMKTGFSRRTSSRAAEIAKTAELNAGDRRATAGFPVVRLLSSWPKWIPRWEGRSRDWWSTGENAYVGQIHLFCVTAHGDGLKEFDGDPRVDAVHSIWRAMTPATTVEDSRWPVQCQLERVLALQVPVPKRALVSAGLLASAWPQSPKGKVFVAASLDRLCSVLCHHNPRQAIRIRRALLGPLVIESAEDLWERVRDYAVQAMQHQTPVFTLQDGVENFITDVSEGSIRRRSARGKENKDRVTRRQVHKLWAQLRGGPAANVLAFARALVARAAPDHVEVSDDGVLQLR